MSIEFSGDFLVAAPRDSVFETLSDAEKFAPLLPTYKSHAAKEDGSTDIRIKVAVGKIRGTATVNVALDEANAPDRASYKAKGKVMGAAFNFGAGFDLEDAGDSTCVNWRGDLSMFGKLVSLAGGLIRPIADKQITALINDIRLSLEQSGEGSA